MVLPFILACAPEPAPPSQFAWVAVENIAPGTILAAEHVEERAAVFDRWQTPALARWADNPVGQVVAEPLLADEVIRTERLVGSPEALVPEGYIHATVDAVCISRMETRPWDLVELVGPDGLVTESAVILDGFSDLCADPRAPSPVAVLVPEDVVIPELVAILPTTDEGEHGVHRRPSRDTPAPLELPELPEREDGVWTARTDILTNQPIYGDRLVRLEGHGGVLDPRRIRLHTPIYAGEPLHPARLETRPMAYGACLFTLPIVPDVGMDLELGEFTLAAPPDRLQHVQTTGATTETSVTFILRCQPARAIVASWLSGTDWTVRPG